MKIVTFLLSWSFLLFAEDALLYDPHQVGEDSLHTALSFYPLHSGDEWRYKITTYEVGPNPSISYATRKVTGDTIMPNGETYFIVNELFGIGRSVRFERIDSTDNVVRFYEHDESDEKDVAVYPLFYRDTTFIWYDDMDIPLQVTFQDSALYLIKDWLLLETYFLENSLGVTYYSISEGGESNYALIGAIIDGKSWGTYSALGEGRTDPESFVLLNNYPNPFNPTTTIRYSVGAYCNTPQQSQRIDLSVYNLLGQKVATLVSKKQTPGNYEIEWNSTGFASGIYYYQLVAGEYREVRKMIILR